MWSGTGAFHTFRRLGTWQVKLSVSKVNEELDASQPKCGCSFTLW